ncbi:MAG: arsenite methyltransferase [Candidatus Bathyarchaeia archaeon]|nr:arsenite methyltransferase [Candidatus Bathyarchaeota archaeon A05DMB-4]MDH7594871.1 arsenite methyltransferase [Candidatus Bathyarchaeota archaeon]
MKERRIKKTVRESYAKIAKGERSCCGPSVSSCGCATINETISKQIGYSDTDLRSVPEGANLGLGCGNPVALASLKEGETVLDLGSGAGFDCFLAANKVGAKGKVIGVDMTAEMIDKARENARKGEYENVEFRLGEIENLPVADSTVDVVISNCVINLSTNKPQVFREAFRVLKPNGRLMISDIILLKELPDAVKKNVEAYVDCLSGAIKKDEYLRIIRAAGFRKIKIHEETRFPIELMANDSTAKAIIQNLKIPEDKIKETAETAVSIKISAIKPKK